MSLPGDFHAYWCLRTAVLEQVLSGGNLEMATLFFFLSFFLIILQCCGWNLGFCVFWANVLPLSHTPSPWNATLYGYVKTFAENCKGCACDYVPSWLSVDGFPQVNSHLDLCTSFPSVCPNSVFCPPCFMPLYTGVITSFWNTSSCCDLVFSSCRAMWVVSVAYQLCDFVKVLTFLCLSHHIWKT